MPLELREQIETIEVQRGILLGLWLLLLPLLLAADFLERNHFDFVLVGLAPPFYSGDFFVLVMNTEEVFGATVV